MQKGVLCSICGVEEAKKKISDGYICSSCRREALLIMNKIKVDSGHTMSLKKWTVEETKYYIDTDSNERNMSETRNQIFNVTEKISDVLEIDRENNLFRLYIRNPKTAKLIETPIYAFEEIKTFELLEDGASVAKGGLGRAIVGKALFGGIGAIVGGVTGKRKTKDLCNSIEVWIDIENRLAGIIKIPLIFKPVKKSKQAYKNAYFTAKSLITAFNDITATAKVVDNTLDQEVSYIEELKQLKELVDAGIVSQEEFENKKKELLKIQ